MAEVFNEAMTILEQLHEFLWIEVAGADSLTTGRPRKSRCSTALAYIGTQIVVSIFMGCLLDYFQA